MIPRVNPTRGWIVFPSLSKIDRARRLRTEKGVYLYNMEKLRLQSPWPAKKGPSNPIDVIYEKGQTMKPSSIRPNKEHSGAQIVGSG